VTDALTTHTKALNDLVESMRRLQSCPDRIDMSYRLGKLSDLLELRIQQYLSALAIELMQRQIEQKRKSK